ncbi:hypothetical protein [Candidatus Tremblaya phenacola]|uniref:hypothetical protein n=1 Tax=Candidatus Tremblayella phenacoccinincola TaxID=1010676 RepID=UPI001649D4DC|nr:hypothetical protein [Candidatus Tremblaya phenacola]
MCAPYVLPSLYIEGKLIVVCLCSIMMVVHLRKLSISMLRLKDGKRLNILGSLFGKQDYTNTSCYMYLQSSEEL